MVDSFFSEGPIRTLQDVLSPLFDPFFIGITTTGSTVFLLVLSLLVFWLWDKRAGLLLGVVLLSSSALNGALKALFQMPRPPSSLHRSYATGNGFPSGHAQQTTAFWSPAALTLQRAWAVLAPLLIVLVALSRVYLGVHYVGDVLGGIAFGLTISAVAIIGYRAGFWRRVGTRARLVLAVLLPSPLGLLYFMQPDFIRIYGLLVGISAGYVLEAEWVGLGRVRGLSSATIRLLGGIPPLAGLYALSLRLSSPHLLIPLHIAMGLGATLLLPWLFKFLESRLVRDSGFQNPRGE